MLPNFQLCKFTKSQLVETIIQNLNLPLNITSCIACIQFGIYIKKMKVTKIVEHLTNWQMITPWLNKSCKYPPSLATYLLNIYLPIPT